MRFICDDNLGRLAKYLRILGLDTAFIEPVSDPDLLRLAAEQQRFLLTRDHHLLQYSHPYGILIIEEDRPLSQLTITIETLQISIDPDLLFQRCSQCNELTLSVDKELVKDSLFPYILKTQTGISRCPSCGRYYWKGSHYKRLLAQLRSAIPDKALVGLWPEIDETG
jgi:uncharacterized protein